MTILTLDSEDSGHTGGNREKPRHWSLSAVLLSPDSATEQLAWGTGLGHALSLSLLLCEGDCLHTCFGYCALFEISVFGIITCFGFHAVRCTALDNFLARKSFFSFPR